MLFGRSDLDWGPTGTQWPDIYKPQRGSIPFITNHMGLYV